MGSIRVRPVGEEDLRSCAELFVSVFNGPPWNEGWGIGGVLQRLAECYHTPGYYGLLSEEGKSAKLVGFVLGNIERWDASKHFYIKEMCVSTRYQRKGIGSDLMATLETELKAQGAAKMYLLTARDTAAQSFYERCGFYVSPKMIMMGKWIDRD